MQITFLSPKLNYRNGTTGTALSKYSIQLASEMQFKIICSKICSNYHKNLNKEMKNQTKVIIENNPLPTIQKPRILGVTFDIFFIFTEHIASDKQNPNTQKLTKKALWYKLGCSKETLNITQKAIWRNVLNYAAPVWTPSVNDFRWKDLETRKNPSLEL